MDKNRYIIIIPAKNKDAANDLCAQIDPDGGDNTFHVSAVNRSTGKVTHYYTNWNMMAEHVEAIQEIKGKEGDPLISELQTEYEAKIITAKDTTLVDELDRLGLKKKANE